MVEPGASDNVEYESLEFDSIASAVDDIRAGKMVIVTDSEDRENEGDFIMSAEKITAENVNFMVTKGRGLVCVPMEGSRLESLDLKQMCSNNTARLGTRFTVSVDLLENTTTGISVFDRARTINALADKRVSGLAFGRPGHVFPLEAAGGGVLNRLGHTEAALDLCRLAGLEPVGVLCEIMSDNGTMARTPELMEKAREWGVKIITISDLIYYLRQNPEMMAVAEKQKFSEVIEVAEKITDVALPTRFGEFRLHLFNSTADGKDHLALVKGDLAGRENVLTRIHSECLTGDTFGSERCDCGAQLSLALERIEAEGHGLVLYMRQEGRGIGLGNKIKAYALQDQGADTVEANHKLGFEADLRDYTVSASMIRQLGVKSVELMTNNPSKINGLVTNGITVVSRSSLETPLTAHNEKYLNAKRDKLGHLFGNIETKSLRSGCQ